MLRKLYITTACCALLLAQMGCEGASVTEPISSQGEESTSQGEESTSQGEESATEGQTEVTCLHDGDVSSVGDLITVDSCENQCECSDTGEWVNCTTMPCGDDLCKDVICEPTAGSCENTYSAIPGVETACDAATGECVAVEEPTPIACGDNEQVCLDGACVDSDNPCDFMLCETGSSCFDGECYWTYCEGACGSECDANYPGCEGKGFCNAYNECICDSNPPPVCEEDLCVNVTCEDNQVCVEGNCVTADLCADVVCVSTDAYCDGYVAISGTYSECDPSTGECLEAPGLAPQDCWEMGMTCEEGQCVESNDPCFQILCEAGSECYEGQCVDVFCKEPCGEACINPTPGCETFAYCNASNHCTCLEDGDEPFCPNIDLCDNVICPSSAPFCEDNVAYSGTYSECNPSTGECEMSPGAPPQNCGSMGMTCVDGYCADDLCGNFVHPCNEDSECEQGEVCSFDGCNPSSCGCDPETGDTFCTEDCGGGVCVEDLCADVECVSTPPSCDGDWALSGTFSTCDPNTGECIYSAGAPPQDCGSMGMTCYEGMCTDDLCAGFVPPCAQDEDCPGTDVCSFDGCNPSNCSCNIDTGMITCTSDCGGGVCVPPSKYNPCENKVCGENCSPCAPGEMCPQFLVPNVCDGQGQCVSEASTYNCVGDSQCFPGSTFMDDDDCNTCECPVSGMTSEANCTKLFCP